MSQSTRSRLTFEALEVRDVPATATLTNGVLDIRGTGTHDTIIITEAGGILSINNTKIKLVDNRLLTSVGIGSVSRIYVDAGPGHDTVNASTIVSEYLTIIGGTGNDTILAGAKNDFIYARNGDDSINGGAGNDQIFGENGNDEIHGGDGRDLIFGGNDNDEIFGGAGNDTIKGEYGDDALHGDDGDDRFEGGDGEDTINGGAGNDVGYGQAGDDVLNGGSGNDRLYGQTGSDVIHGDAGDDTIAGGDGGDLLFGDEGADAIFAGDVSDVLNGGDGTDTLIGGGNDILVGGENTNNNNNNNNNNNTNTNPNQPPANSQGVVTSVRAQWVDGLTADVQVSNKTNAKITGWRVEFDAKFDIPVQDGVWNAQMVSKVPLQGGGWRYSIENIPNFFNSSINANGRVEFGYNASFPPNTSLAITNITLNGAPA